MGIASRNPPSSVPTLHCVGSTVEYPGMRSTSSNDSDSSSSGGAAGGAGTGVALVTGLNGAGEADALSGPAGLVISPGYR